MEGCRSSSIVAAIVPGTDGETWQYWEIADETTDVEELYAGHERVERLRRAICQFYVGLWAETVEGLP